MPYDGLSSANTGYSVGSTGMNVGGNDPYSNPNLPDLNPEPYDPTVWKNFWTFKGQGFEKYGVPKETFYLAYQRADFNALQYEHTVKLYRITTGQYTTEQTVATFEIEGMYGIETVQREAIIKAKIWLVNRYMNYPYDMGELEWDESKLWAESYVNGGGNDGVMMLWAIGILTLIGILFLR